MPILVKARPARERPRYAKIGIYGDPGVGKTHLAGTIEDITELVSRSLMLDIEGGTMTLSDRNIDVIRISTWAEIQEAYTDLYQMCHAETWDGPKYDAVIVDSLSELQKINMAEIMKIVKRDNPDRDELVPGQREWGKSSESIRRLIRAFRDLPIHVIFIFLAKEDKDDVTGETKVRPSLPGKLAAEVSGFLDIVGYLYVDIENEKDAEGKPTGRTVSLRKLLVQPTQKYTAKDRSGRLGTGLRNPTMRDILGPVLQFKQNLPTEEEKEEIRDLLFVKPDEVEVPA